MSEKNLVEVIEADEKGAAGVDPLEPRAKRSYKKREPKPKEEAKTVSPSVFVAIYGVMFELGKEISGVEPQEAEKKILPELTADCVAETWPDSDPGKLKWVALVGILSGYGYRVTRGYLAKVKAQREANSPRAPVRSLASPSGDREQ